MSQPSFQHLRASLKQGILLNEELIRAGVFFQDSMTGVMSGIASALFLAVAMPRAVSAKKETEEQSFLQACQGLHSHLMILVRRIGSQKMWPEPRHISSAGMPQIDAHMTWYPASHLGSTAGLPCLAAAPSTLGKTTADPPSFAKRFCFLMLQVTLSIADNRDTARYRLRLLASMQVPLILLCSQGHMRQPVHAVQCAAGVGCQADTASYAPQHRHH